jgi:L-aspartate semialdehyde sulfurtransferase ferredoxin
MNRPVTTKSPAGSLFIAFPIAGDLAVPDEATHSKRCWFTFPTRAQVEQPIIWQMSKKFPDLVFDIRQASVQHEIGIMAVLLSGREGDVSGAIEFLRSKGVTVEPIEKSVVEG